jgi:DNA end-binding protein Ku
MQRSERAGIGRFVMRTKQYLAAIRASDRVLMLHTLYFADEIRDVAGLDLPARVKLAPRELSMAQQLIESQTVAWDPKRYEDTYRAEVLAIVRKKSRGAEIVAEEPPEPTAKVVDLREALEASLAQSKRPRKRRRKAS